MFRGRDHTSVGRALTPPGLGTLPYKKTVRDLATGAASGQAGTSVSVSSSKREKPDSIVSVAGINYYNTVHPIVPM